MSDTRSNNERTADQILPGGAEVTSAYRRAGFSETPSAALDRRILAAARRRSRRKAWLQPLAIAASLVITGVLVLRHHGGQDAGQDPVGPQTPTSPIAEPLRMQQTREAAPAGTDDAAAASVGADSAGVDGGRCPPAVRDDPERWLACIDTLTDADAAAAERELFDRSYPDAPAAAPRTPR